MDQALFIVGINHRSAAVALRERLAFAEDEIVAALGRMAAFGTGPLIASSVGIVLLGLLRTPLRWSGAVVLALATIWALAVPQPDILISGDAHNVVVRGRDGAFHLMRSAKDAFLVKEWLAGDADARLPVDPALANGISASSKTGVRASLWAK